jgi:hypothetical protein
MTRRIAAGAARIAGAFALAGALSMLAIMPASAASPNRSYATAATGLISSSPIGAASYPGTSPVTSGNANIAGLVTTGTYTDTADATDASSTVASVSGTLSTLFSLSAESVESSCTFNTNTGLVTGTTTITDGSAMNGLTTIPLTQNPAPNTTVSGLSGVASVTLNAQSTATDGTLTVTAIQISLLGSTQTLNIGTSVCNAANLAPVPVLPGKTMSVTLGAAGMLGLGGIGLQLRRRRPGRVAITRGTAAGAR